VDGVSGVDGVAGVDGVGAVFGSDGAAAGGCAEAVMVKRRRMTMRDVNAVDILFSSRE
jgi:hypothetical protein